MRSWGALLLAVLIGCAITAGIAFNGGDGAAPPRNTAADPGAQTALIAHGKYLADAADCMACHTGPGHAPFSGGLTIPTPFGGLASTNITPDKTTGIGNWTDAQFWRAIHLGISPGRTYLVFPHFLYPAMPFTSYTELSRVDVAAIKAYLFSLEPVTAAPAPNSLKFPFSMRPILLGWRILFFRPGPMRMEPSWSVDVRRGAYLTVALGHCGECHTPRNFMSAMIAAESLAGAHIDAYYAPNISSDKSFGIGDWSRADLVSYLFAGGNQDKGSAFGPMGTVVHRSLNRLPQTDVEEIALYLQTGTAPRSTPSRDGTEAARSTADTLGKKIFTSNCAGCHQADGAGRPPIIPGLAGNDALTAAAPTNVIGAVLSGLGPWNHGPAMPSFAALSNAEIAAVANYVRTQWGNKAAANAKPHDVLTARAAALLAPAPPP